MIKLVPRQPDPFIKVARDQEIAKFGHLNYVIDNLNALITTVNNLTPGGSGLETTIVHLDSAQIKSLASSHVELVPQQGINTAIDPVSIMAVLHNSGIEAFTNNALLVGGSTVDISNFPMLQCQLFLSDTSSPVIIHKMFGQIHAFSTEIAPNDALVVGSDADSATGDGNVDIYVLWRKLTLTT